VHDAFFMEELECITYLEWYVTDFFIVEVSLSGLLDAFVVGNQVHGHVLEDKVDEGGDREAFVELYDVGMAMGLMEKLNLTVDDVLDVHVLFWDFFDGNDMASVDINGFVDSAVGARTDVWYNSIIIHVMCSIQLINAQSNNEEHLPIFFLVENYLFVV
jgi:hypothetical protein